MIHMGYVAYYPLGVLADVGGLNSGLAVGLAGFVVVLTVVLVFVMLLRSNGAGKRTASGLGYDAQQGPLGQPQNNPPNAAGWPAPRGANSQGWPQTDNYDYNNPPQGAGGRGAGWEPNFGGQAGGNPASQGAWNNAPSQGAGWGNAGPAANAGTWGNPAPQANAGGWGGQNDQWGQGNNPAGGWDAQPAQAGRPAASAAAFPGTGPWEDQAGANAAWGAPAAVPQRDWNNAPAQQNGSNNGGWGAMPQQQGMPQGAQGFDGAYEAFGEADKTRVVRPNTGQQRLGAVVVRQGKDPGRTFELRKERLTIGRSRESDIFLEDLAVSRLHTTINNDGNGHYIIRDEGSANGTYVNQQRITEQVLEEGDEIQVGQTVLAFVRR